MNSPCIIDGCPNQEATHGGRKGGLCWGHYRRKQKGQTISGLLKARMSPWDRLLEAAIGYADADADDDRAWADAKDALRRAASAYGQSHGQSRAGQEREAQRTETALASSAQ